jgi:hypothetical protein
MARTVQHRPDVHLRTWCVQGGEFLGAGEGLFDLPADAGDADEFGEGDRLRGVGPVEGVFAVADPAPDK